MLRMWSVCASACGACVSPLPEGPSARMCCVYVPRTYMRHTHAPRPYAVYMHALYVWGRTVRYCSFVRSCPLPGARPAGCMRRVEAAGNLIRLWRAHDSNGGAPGGTLWEINAGRVLDLFQ